MTLTQSLTDYVRAAFSGLYVQTVEPDEALREIASLCQSQAWRLVTWDLNRGLTLPNSAADLARDHLATDPLAVVRTLSSLADPEIPTLCVLRGFHRFLGSPEMIQTLEQPLQLGKVHRTFVVVLAPIVQLPVELERLFVVLEHELPDRAQLAAIARDMATEVGDAPEGLAFEALLDAAAGLTRYEAEGAYALSLARHNQLRPDVLWDLKAQTLLKHGVLSLHRGGDTFEQLGGLAAIKAFCKRSLLPRERPDPRRRPRGILMLGVPGTGKSAFARSLGAETGRPTLNLDIGALLGSLVGQTEQNIRQALRIADAMAPAILFCDEIDKALAGVTGSGQGDSGVSARLFGTLLTWLSDRTSDVYVVATCNDIGRLPPEFARSERFDAVFFLDLPTALERQAIWNLYLPLFELDLQQPRPADEGWTGAEVRACCRLAALLDLPLVEAARYIVPVAATAAESVERLRSWASGRCLSANVPGLYQRSDSAANSRRRVRRDPSAN